jgi:hypothetical protein
MRSAMVSMAAMVTAGMADPFCLFGNIAKKCPRGGQSKLQHCAVRRYIAHLGIPLIPRRHYTKEKNMATPVVPSQFQVGKNRIVHKPTKSTFNFETGQGMFKSVEWGSVGEQQKTPRDYRREDVMRVAQQLLMKLPK